MTRGPSAATPGDLIDHRSRVRGPCRSPGAITRRNTVDNRSCRDRSKIGKIVLRACSARSTAWSEAGDFS